MGSSKSSRALRERARTRIVEAQARSRRVLDAWQAATERQIAALDDVGAGALADDGSTAEDLAKDLCAQWVGYWADAMELLHQACRACVHPPSGETPTPNSTINKGGVEVPLIAFAIERFAEAADPLAIPDVAVADAPNIVNNGLAAAATVGGAIPSANVRISTYGSRVLVSLVELGPLKLVPGQYQGDLVIGSQTIAVVRVTVT